ncbi:MAG: OsmC family protein [Deltaproteobacteria bacterium]|nr:OsmC family protein [Deltaproteobacteria bacterium]
MKNHILTNLLLIFTVLFIMSTITQANEKPAPYKIKVTSREVKNRIVESRVRNHRVVIDQPTDFGADDLGPTPPEYLAIAYGSCVVSTLRFLAVLDKLEIQNIEVRVEGEVDFSRIMGLTTSNRAGLSGLRVFIKFESTMTEIEKKAFVKKAMELGAVLDNVQNKTDISYEIVD